VPNADEVERNATPPQRTFSVGAALFVLTFALYAPTARFKFLGYDDYLYVGVPAVQQGLTWAGVRWSLGIGQGRIYFHPLAWVSHMLDAQLFGVERPGPHHLMNAVYHAVAAALLFVALRRLTGTFWRSAMVAALFAWHPLHVQSVAWVAERKDVLSGVTFALALIVYAWYARRPSVARYVAVVVSVAIALASKPTSVTLPCVMLLLDYWPLKRPAGWARLVGEKVPLLALSLAASVVSYKLQLYESAIRPVALISVHERLGNAAMSYVRYLYKTLVPIRLSVFDPYESWRAWQVIGAAAVVVAITLLALRDAKRRPYLIVGWFWFLGMMVPMIGLIQAGSQSVADRYTYLPLTGVFIAVVWLASEWARDEPRRRRTLAWIAGFVLACSAGVTLYQQQFWRDELTLFSRALEVTRENWLAHGFVAKNLAERDEDDLAAYHYRESLRIHPNYVEGHFNFANLLRRHEQFDAAAQHYRRVTELKPDMADGWNSLGAALASQGRLVEAEAAFARAASLAPERQDIAGNLARVRAAQAAPPI
jgi:tetratricopeptide (TPR) repeat protein